MAVSRMHSAGGGAQGVNSAACFSEHARLGLWRQYQRNVSCSIGIGGIRFRLRSSSYGGCYSAYHGDSGRCLVQTRRAPRPVGPPIFDLHRTCPPRNISFRLFFQAQQRGRSDPARNRPNGYDTSACS